MNDCFQERKNELERQLKTIYHKIELYTTMLQGMKDLKEQRELELAEINNMIEDMKILNESKERAEEPKKNPDRLMFLIPDEHPADKVMFRKQERKE